MSESRHCWAWLVHHWASGHAAGKVSGTITAASVIGPLPQLVTAGQLDEVIAAIRAGVAYGNVHSSAVPGGEIRGQLK